MRIPRFFQTDEKWDVQPDSNKYYDYTKKNFQLNYDLIGTGYLANVNLSTNFADINIGPNTYTGYVSTRFQHWFSGGEFTVPCCGTNALVFAHNGNAALISSYGSENIKSYYRLNYGQFVKPDIEPASINNLNGAPLDIMHGDMGFHTPDGYTFGLLSGGPLLLRANPMASIELYDIDTSVRINSLNYKHNSSLGEKKINYNFLKKVSNQTFSWHPTDFNSIIIKEYKGSVGDLITTTIDKTYFDNIKQNGKKFTKLNNDYILTVGELAEIEDTQIYYDPEKKGGTEPEPVPDFDWLENGKIAQQNTFSENIEKYYYKTLKYKEPLDKSNSMLHLRKDGSIILMSKSGSTIELSSDGDIIISPKRHLKIQSGKNTSILAGGYFNVVSKENLTLRTTDNHIQFISRKDIKNVANENIYLSSKNNYFKSMQDICLEAGNLNFNSSNLAVKNYSSNFDINTFRGKYNHYFLNTNLYNLLSENKQEKINKNYLINTGNYRLGCKTFKLAGTLSGIITATTPVKLNHTHSTGFTYAWCGQGKCKVTKITNKVGLGTLPTINLKNLSNLNISSNQVELSQNYSLDEVYYFTPWQQKSRDSWTSLSIFDYFPKTNELFNYVNNKMEKIEWQNYRI